ncbi:Uncharacterized protein AXF42_Ash013564 [Apostasia shenzhenica]|uniref:RRM domain-containing protein n=1 Tax=Apostasia shenzhenica TaxID=1088818 RepID=A0A2I0AP90_9ASPA|nr:Uncharacterized protein AXF42_Ash013564 [Apostasia shenzhenica]
MEQRPKRSKPTLSSSMAKRLRPPPVDVGGIADPFPAVLRSSPSSSAVMVTDLPHDCTVLELKSRLEMYGPISRIRIDVNGCGYVTFRSDQAAEAAIAASQDPAFGIAIASQKVLVVRASDPMTHWRIGVGASATSKLLRAAKPLRKHGTSKKQIIPGASGTENGQAYVSYTEREIRAYDDLF